MREPEKKPKRDQSNKYNKNKPARNTHPDEQHYPKTLGRVRFFDADKGFGFVQSLDGQQDSFLHIRQLRDKSLAEGDLLVYKAITSAKKPGTTEAWAVEYKIPVYVYHHSNEQTYACVCLPGYKKFHAFEEKHEAGFALVTIQEGKKGWKVIDGKYIDRFRDLPTYASTLLHVLLPHAAHNMQILAQILGELNAAQIQLFCTPAMDAILAGNIPTLRKILPVLTALPLQYWFSNLAFGKLALAMWLEGLLPTLPDVREAQELSLLNTWDHQALSELLDRIEEVPQAIAQYAYQRFLQQGVAINGQEDIDRIWPLLARFGAAAPAVVIQESHFKCSNAVFHVRLWEKGILKELSPTTWKKYLSSLGHRDQQLGFLYTLPLPVCMGILSAVPEYQGYTGQYLLKQIEQRLTFQNLCAFDLESNGTQIFDIGWVSAGQAQQLSDFQDLAHALEAFCGQQEGIRLWIGHNIRAFDLPILADKLTVSPLEIWDTLEVEVLLDPTKSQYALAADHTALADAQQCHQLFLNQCARLISAPELLKQVQDALPAAIGALLWELQQEWTEVNWPSAAFTQQAIAFFKTEATTHMLPPTAAEALKEKLATEGKKLVVVPSLLQGAVFEVADVRVFQPSEKEWLFVLSDKKVRHHLAHEPWLRVVLSQFIQVQRGKELLPYYKRLPKFLRMRLQQSGVALADICTCLDLAPAALAPICYTPTFFPEVQKHLEEQPDTEVIVLGEQLYALENKIRLGQDIDFVQLFDALKHEPIWMQMSGGKGFVPLSKEQVERLGIREMPKHTANLWIEKLGQGKFAVWASQDLQATLQDWSSSSCHSITWEQDAAEKKQAYVVRPDARASRYLADHLRVNPESLYRSAYWTYQLKLLDGLSKTAHPKVLLLNGTEEIEQVAGYARSLGFFVPESAASLSRRIELLHAHPAGKKLLLVHIAQLPDVLTHNHTAALDFVWDSFLLQEKQQMCPQLLSKMVLEAEDRENDFSEDAGLAVDKIALIKMHLPLLEHYYSMLMENHPDTVLYLCDPRLSDYQGIERTLQMNHVRVAMWDAKEEYERDFALASPFLQGMQQNGQSDFDMAQAKALLSRIFLGEHAQWRKYQDVCLDEILPANLDRLISLPTGAGKSLLFQAPALFRAAFSCKMSLVVSPLRALMQDQVNGLNKRGFLHNVEYMSGDKSFVEIRDIYRRMVGGEISLLYITPERLRSRAFENALLARMSADNGMEYAVFDEAHCISQWGQEFRPDYMNAARKLTEYRTSMPFAKLLFSATISEQVFRDILAFMPSVRPIEKEGVSKNYNPVRDHIRIDFKHQVADENRLKEVAQYLKEEGLDPDKSRVLVFVKSRKKAEECTLQMPEVLQEVFGTSCDFAQKVDAFHAGMDAEDREEAYTQFKNGEVVILFATKAFGMGMDIPNIHFVAHYSPSSTFEDFLQEVGRAGRNEADRQRAGFSSDRPIRTLCLTAAEDFKKLKTQLHQSRVHWQNVKDYKTMVERYVARFRPLVADKERPMAIPLNLNTQQGVDIDDDVKFRVGLHWLEQLGRIRLGYFTNTHIAVEVGDILTFAERMHRCPDQLSERVCQAIAQLLQADSTQQQGEVALLSVSALSDATGLSLNNLFSALLKAHAAGVLRLRQEVPIVITRIRTEEVKYGSNSYSSDAKKYPAIKVIFALAKELLSAVPMHDSRQFKLSEIETLLDAHIKDAISYTRLPWGGDVSEEKQQKEFERYIKDIKKKRMRHALTVLRLLDRIKVESVMRLPDQRKGVEVLQSIFNGYHKEQAWQQQLDSMQQDAIRLLDYLAQRYYRDSKEVFEWADIIQELKLRNLRYLSDLLFILSVLGYVRAGSLMPSGIEIYLEDLDAIQEQDTKHRDATVFAQFEQTRKMRELKLLALEVLGLLHKQEGNVQPVQDKYIREYFACETIEQLLRLLQQHLPADSRLLDQWRGEAIIEAEKKLNPRQKEVYDAPVDRHINVMAGPGSGKTHTLTLRVARLIHHVGIPPEQILVLAYNRAVVSELKERLDKLFNNLGYGSLAKRIKIFTFHGLAKKYCGDQLKGEDFDRWEPTLDEILRNRPGAVLQFLAPLRYILVDEFQDINPIRISLLQQLQQLTNAYLFVIGDPNQSIYGYERIQQHGSMSPWPYYQNFEQLFNPLRFSLQLNYRSYPNILHLSKEFLLKDAVSEEYQGLSLMPEANRPCPGGQYALVNRGDLQGAWWKHLPTLLQEKISDSQGSPARPYRQIAVLLRTNSEVYYAYQKIQELEIAGVRVRIQGSMPYEFSRIRECHVLLEYLKSALGTQITPEFFEQLQQKIATLERQHPDWNHFYLRVVQALVLEYIKDCRVDDTPVTTEALFAYVQELTQRDDGQLYKIYEQYADQLGQSLGTEIVLTTMHKVKGLEFDAVLVPPSFYPFPLVAKTEKRTSLDEYVAEERRLYFVAYTRARYRLLAWNGPRERALLEGKTYVISDQDKKHVGLPISTGLAKMKLCWAAESYNYERMAVNDFIFDHVKSGDMVKIATKHAGGHEFHEVLKGGRAIAQLSRGLVDILKKRSPHARVFTDLVVNEVVIWSYEESCAYDRKHNTSYSSKWCPAARQKGYIYLIDFAGFANPN